tara:strand:+ start:61629 stop:62726 length:1098 start_codon:yes stop_codon:yes gene_type:complete
MKICTIIGARPQFVKAAAVSRIMASTPDIKEVIIHTGQHYDYNLSGLFFDELSIPKPSYNLNIGSGLHGQQTGKMLEAIEEILMQEKPDWVLLYGDTNSTLAGALAASKLHYPIAHIEAGLRSFNRKMPEEINRILTDQLSTLLFAPTKNGYDQLIKEGFSPESVCLSGDVMLDATLYYNENNTHENSTLENLSLKSKEYILSTIHRAENTDNTERLINICNALIELSSNSTVVLPLHARTRAALNNANLLKKLDSHVQLIEPVGYLDMLALEKNAELIITDSGGVQKEAYFNAVHCITLRDETEWVELVSSGWNQLCSPSTPFSLSSIANIKTNQKNMVYSNLYGEGDASLKIINAICTFGQLI